MLGRFGISLTPSAYLRILRILQEGCLVYDSNLNLIRELKPSLRIIRLNKHDTIIYNNFSEKKLDMAQSDFSCLAVPINFQGNVGQDGVDFEKEIIIHANKDKDLVSNYVPVNFIPDELHALIIAWELSAAKSTRHQTSSDNAENDDAPDAAMTVSFSESVYEPTRRVDNSAPPKRFYRAFWVSTSRRILAHSKRHTI
jgi:hypothetical protein